MSSWSEAECPHCHKMIPFHMTKKIYPERTFFPAPPTLACPRCGGIIKNSMHSSGWFAGAIFIIVATQTLRLLGYNPPLAITAIAILLAFVGMFMAAKTNHLVKGERQIGQEVKNGESSSSAGVGLMLWTFFKQVVCGLGVLLCLLALWEILKQLVVAPSFGLFIGLLATVLMGALIYIFGFVSWSRLLGKE